jgi:uncharacterized PurR-regulated membrane protein YhhQ (DUF165 family)
MAPSGVLMIGLALVLRDLVQRRLGFLWAAGAILAGAALSALLAPPALVLASAVAFLLSELADLGVYTPLQRHRFMAAVIAMNSLLMPRGGAMVGFKTWYAFISRPDILGTMILTALVTIAYVVWHQTRRPTR